MTSVQVGDMLHGACMGIFGNLHHGCVKVEAIGDDWIVGRPIDNDWAGQPMTDHGAVFACGEYVLADAGTNRNGGLQDGCRSSFSGGCSYSHEYDPNY